MDNYIEKIYKLLKSPIVTPHNLLENAKLNNYTYVKYFKGENGLIAEMKCIVDDLDTIFKYEFDNNDHLIRIQMMQNNINKYVFDRNIELAKTTNDYYELNRSNTEFKAI